MQNKAFSDFLQKWLYPLHYKRFGRIIPSGGTSALKRQGDFLIRDVMKVTYSEALQEIIKTC
jgi:hypothetical protein